MSEILNSQDALEQSTGMPSEVPCLLIPIKNGDLVLLPNSSVAEILPLAQYKPDTNGQDWLVGSLDWRSLTIPLVSMELLCGKEVQHLDTIANIAVFNGCMNSESLPFYGVLVEGIPRLVRVSSNGVGVQDGQLEQAEEMRVLVNGESAIIPKLDFIERQLLAHIANTG